MDIEYDEIFDINCWKLNCWTLCIATIKGRVVGRYWISTIAVWLAALMDAQGDEPQKNETKQWNHNSRGWKVKTKWGRERHNSPNITPTHNSPCSSEVDRAAEKRRKALLLVSSAAAGRAGCNSLECLSNPPQPQINYNWKPLPVFTGFHHKKNSPTNSELACT